MEVPATQTKVILAKTYHEVSEKIGTPSPFFNLDPWWPTETFAASTSFSTTSYRQNFGDGVPIIPESA